MDTNPGFLSGIHSGTMVAELPFESCDDPAGISIDEPCERGARTACCSAGKGLVVRFHWGGEDSQRDRATFVRAR
jgi:hypothetical protein